MLRSTRAALRRRGGGGRKTPKFLSSLPTPAVRRPWGRLSDMSPEERREVTAGAWRAARPVQLLPQAEGHAAPPMAQLSSMSSSPPPESSAEPLTFPSDEAAEAYLAAEHDDEQRELRVPALRLAQDFFHELAAAADDEIDVEAAAIAGAGPQSEEERRAEARAANRDFFIDYYLQQRVVPDPARPAAFVNALLTPATALVRVNGDRVLARLVARDQLARDWSGVFRPTADPLVYGVATVPPQLIDAEDPPQLIDAEDAAPSPEWSVTSADMLAAIVDDDSFPPPGDGDETERVSGAVEDTVTLSPAASALAVPSTPPLSVGQLHWLQRLVASDVLHTTNILSLIVALLAVRLAAPAGSPLPEGGSQRVSVVYDPYSAGQRTSYHRDIAACAAALAERVVVAAALPLSEWGEAGQQRRQRRRGAAAPETEEGDDDLLSASAASRLSVADTEANLVYLRPSRRAAGPAGAPAAWLCRQLIGNCSVVLCAPRTSEDGVRPRAVLGDGGEAGQGTSAGAAAVPDRFIAICEGLVARYAALKAELAAALQHCAGDGGWLLYVTQSMNPVENEAVVCAVLSEARRARDDARSPFHNLSISAVPLSAVADSVVLPLFADDEERSEWLAWLRCGQVGGGLRAWAALEEAPADMEAGQHDPALVAAVAAASWRLTPSDRSAFDGGYLCLLRVEGGAAAVAAAADRLLPPLGIISHHQFSPHQRRGGSGAEGAASLVSLCTSATAAFVAQRATAPAPPHRRAVYGDVVAAGLPVGERGGRGGALRLSSAVSGRSAVSRWLQGGSPPPGVATLRLSALLLVDLLRARAVSDGELRGLLFSLRHGALPPQEAATAPLLRAEVEEALAAIAALDDGAAEARTVAVEPLVSARVLPGGADAALHEAVVAELAEARILAELRFTPAAAEGGRAAFRLSLQPLSSAWAERRAHEAAVAESAVALRDALLYVLRRVGCPVQSLLQHQHQRGYDDDGDGDSADGPAAGAAGDGPIPAHGRLIEMDDSDYDVERAEGGGSAAAAVDGPASLSAREMRQRGRRLRHLEGQLRDADGGGGSAADWARQMPASRRRRQRR